MATLKSIARYEIRTPIGHGGMGTLYLARDPSIDRLVAIKLLTGNLDRSDLRDRFAREARTAGTLSHTNIVTIFDYGVFQNGPYIVMEYIRGETLAELISRRPPVPLVQKLILLEQLCRGVAYAHEAGVIHRDIKPSNLMIDQNGVLKILDFGIARLTESIGTRASAVVGTPGYMSPEQIEGGEINRATDLFAVGAVAYEMLTYARAFPGSSQIARIHSVLHTQPAPIQSFAPDVTPELAAVIERALDRNADARYQDATALRRDIRRERRALPVTLGVGSGTLSMAFPHAALVQGPTTPAPSEPIRPSGDERLDRARLAIAAGAYPEARSFVREAMASDPDRTEVHALRDFLENHARMADLLDRARADLGENRLAEAGELVSRALTIQPGSEIARQLKSMVDARRLEDRLRAAGSSRSRIALAWGRWYLDEHAWGAARRAADEAIALGPENADALALRAEADAGELPLRPATDPKAPEDVWVPPVLPTPRPPAPPRSRRDWLVWTLVAAVAVLAVIAVLEWLKLRG